jgi:hypothetical protein
MIMHRANRDIEKCRERYGDAWKTYEKMVPYLFIPVSVPTHMQSACISILTLICSMSSSMFYTAAPALESSLTPFLRFGF